jgi:hypothetical protein
MVDMSEKRKTIFILSFLLLDFDARRELKALVGKVVVLSLGLGYALITAISFSAESCNGS